jgi:hypothetical protein
MSMEVSSLPGHIAAADNDAVSISAAGTAMCLKGLRLLFLLLITARANPQNPVGRQATCVNGGQDARGAKPTQWQRGSVVSIG